jgi:hypothetical protein
MSAHEDSPSYGFPDAANTDELKQVWLELTSYDFEEQLQQLFDSKKSDQAGYWICARIMDAYVSMNLDYRHLTRADLLHVVEEWALQFNYKSVQATFLIASFYDVWGFYLRPNCMNSTEALLYLKQFGYMNGELNPRVHYGTKKFTQLLGQLAGALRLYGLLTKEPYLTIKLVMKLVDCSSVTARMLIKVGIEHGIFDQPGARCSWAKDPLRPVKLTRWVPLELREEPPSTHLKMSDPVNIVQFQKFNNDPSKN